MTKIGYVRSTQDHSDDEELLDDLDVDQGDVDDRAMWRECVDQLHAWDTLIVDDADRPDATGEDDQWR